MAKLYAELTSDKGGRVASKGGDNFMSINIYNGNKIAVSIEYNRESNQLHINDETQTMTINVDGTVY